MAGNYFHMKIYKPYLNPDTYPEFYLYHLKYFQSKTSGSEQQFFAVVWDTVNRGIWICQNHPHSVRATKRLQRLLMFQDYLRSIDQWQITFSKDELLEFKSEKIEDLLSKIKELKSQLSSYKVDYKINCPDKESIISLVLNIRDLEDERGNLIFKCSGQSTWAKLISNHFKTDTDIPFDTIMNYLRGKTKISDRRQKISVEIDRGHFTDQ